MPIVVAVIVVVVVVVVVGVDIVVVVAGVAGVVGVVGVVVVVVDAGGSIVTTPVCFTNRFVFVTLSEECRSFSKFVFYGATCAGALAVPSLPTGFSSGLFTNMQFFVTLPDTDQQRGQTPGTGSPMHPQ